ncbi:hypothetical protein ACO0LG_08550 [Undibacterium sp. Ji42W]|uniref:hypothetical protein n=1 Tax=Undibacterium sp. Ji42W TaxID=3413039 RepID=UPI003BF159E7
MAQNMEIDPITMKALENLSNTLEGDQEAVLVISSPSGQYQVSVYALGGQMYQEVMARALSTMMTALRKTGVGQHVHKAPETMQ